MNLLQLPGFGRQGQHALRQRQQFGLVHLWATIATRDGMASGPRYGMKLTGGRRVARFVGMPTTKVSRLCLLTAVVFSSLAFARMAPGAQGADGGKWVSLFNGKDLSGWVIMNDAKFTVTNGVIHVDRSTGWLRTEKEYGDFVVEAEWRGLETNYNSGFYIRGVLVGTPYPTNAFQVNLKETALGQLLRGKTEALPSRTPKFPVNEWVTFRMEARGKKLTLDVNGVRAWEFDKLDTDHGYIGIQAENKLMDFRNVRVRELGGDETSKKK